jgi:hypothetical protein
MNLVNKSVMMTEHASLHHHVASMTDCAFSCCGVEFVGMADVLGSVVEQSDALHHAALARVNDCVNDHGVIAYVPLCPTLSSLGGAAWTSQHPVRTQNCSIDPMSLYDVTANTHLHLVMTSVVAFGSVGVPNVNLLVLPETIHHGIERCHSEKAMDYVRQNWNQFGFHVEAILYCKISDPHTEMEVLEVAC